MIVQCCMCHRVREKASWVRVPDPARVSREASHTFCPNCEQRFRRRWGLVPQKKAS
jgi:hypothetical protein